MQRSKLATPRSRADRDCAALPAILDALCRVIDEQSADVVGVSARSSRHANDTGRRSHLPTPGVKPSHHWRSRDQHFVRAAVTSRRQVIVRTWPRARCSPVARCGAHVAHRERLVHTVLLEG